jgi:hypothetical protein
VNDKLSLEADHIERIVHQKSRLLLSGADCQPEKMAQWTAIPKETWYPRLATSHRSKERQMPRQEDERPHLAPTAERPPPHVRPKAERRVPLSDEELIQELMEEHPKLTREKAVRLLTLAGGL